MVVIKRVDCIVDIQKNRLNEICSFDRSKQMFELMDKKIFKMIIIAPF